jgi:hypothetical protein
MWEDVKLRSLKIDDNLSGGRRMNMEETAKKVCEKSYLKLCRELDEPGTTPGYSFEQYWEKNKEHFTHLAEIYLEVKECLEAK